ncbi:Stealth CR1 domain-containing protein [Glutamicibacter uratoxydans]|uniref:Stealth CR1 domain-containing protein n=1 Tax=Glutamicibacter uratoxydans TaxID=43667 RepID=UPI003D6F22B0
MQIIHTVKRRLSGLPAEVGRKALQKVYAVRTSAESTVRVKRGGATGTSLVNLPIGPRVGFVNPRLQLPQVAADNYLHLETVLKRLDLNFWAIKVAPDLNPTLNLLGEDFATVLKALAAEDSFDNWYFQQLAEDGTETGPIRFLSAVGNNLNALEGIRIWRYVTPSTESSFFANGLQGVDVVRWDTGETTSVIASGVWNPKAVQLPHPQQNPDAFTKALAAANEAAGHYCEFPVDAVITWVDGDDPAWQQRKNEALGQEQDLLIKDATDDARFEPLDELRFCLRSIEQYAPWIRTIYLVTDRQIPKWLKQYEGSRLKVVDHAELWEDPQQLPVFNSHAIEANLHRIEGLSENFLYFNDDVILTSPVSADHFFHPSGLGKVFYSRALVDFAEVSEEDNVSTVASKNSRQVLTGDGLPAMNRKYYHTPYPLNRTVMQEIAERYPHLHRMTSGAKFRSMSDVAFAGSFYFNYALATGRSVPGRIRYDYIDPADNAALARLRAIIRQRNMHCVVVNDGSQAIDKDARERLKRQVPKLLTQLLPVPSSFEA